MKDEEISSLVDKQKEEIESIVKQFDELMHTKLTDL